MQNVASGKRLLFAGLVFRILLLSACSRVDVPTDSGEAEIAPSANEIVDQFLDAWEREDYATMYSLISPRGRTEYDLEAFTRIYSAAAAQIRLVSLEADVSDISTYGLTTVVEYQVTFHSGLFGEIVDSGRIIRLIETPEGWRVAWSTMDIFDGLAESTRLEFRPLVPARGNIYDRNGLPLAEEDGQTVQLYVSQNRIPNYDDCLNTLSRVLHLEVSTLDIRMQQYLPDTRFVIGETDPETYEREAAALTQSCGADTTARAARRYFGEIAPHVVGYVGPIRPEQEQDYQAQGYPPDALVGQEGIEKTFDAQLAGKMGGQLIIVAPTGEIIREITEIPAVSGEDVYLTLDRNLQTSVQQAFVEAYNTAQPTWGATSPGGAAVVMNVRTGEILAMVSYPGFDPGLFTPDSPIISREQAIMAVQSDPRTPLFNRATVAQYPAGSVFKIVSTAAGLDSGIYTPETGFDCQGRWYGAEYGDVLPYRTDWNPEGHGYVNFAQALTYSCDPYYWQLGVELHKRNPQLLAEYARQLGLGVATGQEDITESTGVIPDAEYMRRINQRDWTLADTLNLVIGQGDTQVTPLQITRMVTAVANGGTLYQPLLVSMSQLAGTFSVAEQLPRPATLGYSPTTFDTIREAMCNVTLDPKGTARFVFEEWYPYQASNGHNITVCGKTGTAQTGDANTPPQAWFVAFAPQENPEIAVTVVVENSCEGSEAAAPIVRRIIEDYFGMPHSVWPPLWQEGCTSLGE